MVVVEPREGRSVTTADRAGERPARSAMATRAQQYYDWMRAPAVGGMAAQGSQALASFALQFIIARYLGLEGLGKFAVLFGVILLATSVNSGFVGDSLTVLDRSQPSVRAGLQWWLAFLAIGTGVACSFVTLVTGFLTPVEALAFGLATTTFLVEDTVRRLLMATMQFWRIVVVDLTAMVASLIVILGAAVADNLSLAVMLFALAVGQVAAIVIGWVLLPRSERTIVRMRAPAIGAIANYGTWRALQQAVRTGTVALVRVMCLLVVASAAVGGLEAARIYMAPAVLAVYGVNSYLFASYAAAPTAPVERLLGLADRHVVKLLAGVTLFGLVGVLAIPVLGPVLTDGKYELSKIAVAGWAAFAATIAGVTPYAQLASVRGRHVSVFVLRLVDSVLALLTIYLVVAVTRSVQWAPMIMAAWSILFAVAIREFVIKRGLLNDAPRPEGAAVR